MHPHPAYRWPKHPDDTDGSLERAALEAMISEIGFAMIFAPTPDGPRVAHTPVVSTGDGAVQFHLAKGNALAKNLSGETALCVINGPDAYISPDWYEVENEVPTWNYIALELEGPIRKMNREGLIALLDDLGAREEARLAPKKQWHRDQMDAMKFDRMVDGIWGFELEIKAWRPTAKLHQNKPAEVREKVAAALDDNGRRAMAHMMRTLIHDDNT